MSAKTFELIRPAALERKNLSIKQSTNIRIRLLAIWTGEKEKGNEATKI